MWAWVSCMVAVCLTNSDSKMAITSEMQQQVT